MTTDPRIYEAAEKAYAHAPNTRFIHDIADAALACDRRLRGEAPSWAERRDARDVLTEGEEFTMDQSHDIAEAIAAAIVAAKGEG